MIGAAGGVGAAGLIGLLADESAGVKARLDVALEQQATGKVSGAYAGLGSGVRTSLDLGPAVARTKVWQANIDQATGRLSVTQTALSSISAIASRFEAATATVNGLSGEGVGALATEARQALGQVAQLLNTRSGDVYVFAGQATNVAPVPDTDAGTVGAAVLASDTATAPFAAGLGTAVPQVEVGEGQSVGVGVLAQANTLAVSAAPTTGSYMRDILKGLAQLAGLTDGGAASQAVAADVRARLQSAVGAISDEAGALGDVQAGLASRKTALAGVETALTAQVSNVEDVDMAATLAKVSALQTQLQASYQAVAGVKGLNLAAYL